MRAQGACSCGGTAVAVAPRAHPPPARRSALTEGGQRAFLPALPPPQLPELRQLRTPRVGPQDTGGGSLHISFHVEPLGRAPGCPKPPILISGSGGSLCDDPGTRGVGAGHILAEGNRPSGGPSLWTFAECVGFAARQVPAASGLCRWPASASPRAFLLICKMGWHC